MARSPNSQAGPPDGGNSKVGLVQLEGALSNHASSLDAEDVDVWAYYYVLRKHALVMSLVVLVAVFAAGVITKRQTKQYSSSCSVMLGSSTPRVLTGVAEVVDSQPMTYFASMAHYATQKQIIGSRAIAAKAGALIGILSDDVRTGLDQYEDPVEREEARSQLDPSDIISSMYSVVADEESSILTITAVDEDPAFAAKLANAVAQVYLEMSLERKISGTKDAYAWLTIQHKDLTLKLEESEDELYRFLSENDVLNASLESQFAELTQRVKTFVDKHAEVESKIIQNRLLSKMLKNAKDDPTLLNSLDEIRAEKIVHSHKSKIAELESMRTDLLSERYQKDHPKIKEYDDRIAVFRAKLQKEIDGIVVSLERKQESLVLSERGLRTAIEKERQKEARLNAISKSEKRFRREVETTRGLYDMVTLRMKETDLSSAMRFNSVSILDPAIPAILPFKPSLRRNLFLGFVIGILSALSLALGLEKLDDTIKGQEDVENTLRLPFLGLMPKVQSLMSEKPAKNPAERLVETRKRDLFVLENPKSSAAECARFVRANLLFMSPDRPLKTLMVTSPSPQEGKTTTSVNLAVAMGQSGARTILVDCDMRRPRLHRTFGLNMDIGLSTAIVGEAKIEDAISHGATSEFDVLCCGPIPPNPSELLHTKRFSEVIEELKKRYDYVIFDAPPVGSVADPLVLGTQMDGTLLVLKSGKTKREIAMVAVQSLQNANICVYGAILNGVDTSSRKYGGYYDKYYRTYGGYYETTEEESPSIKKAS
ncbi:MAG: polysaccharide biosynthesis tyrosine autokinase [Deltaproteobacteria bacterium]|nr:polysaccharide biosynthesis tyrosine autokinase [Deltaproteobacteria bacterium]